MPGWIFRTALVVILTLGGTKGANSAVLPPDVVFEGRTLGEWSAEAWKWIYSVPGSKSPSADCDGQWANEGQPGGKVFFVAPMSGEGALPCVRNFTVPADKHLLVPVLPITADNIDTLPPLEIEQFYDALDSVAAAPDDIFASIDGVAVTNLLQYRATSPPFSAYFRDADNHMSVFYRKPVVGLVDPMVVDGYWLLLEPLTPGPHVLRTGGRFRDIFEHEIVANITVAPANQPPVADASATRLRVVSPNPGAAVVLDGSRSFDPGGDALTFVWGERGAIIARGAVANCRLLAGSHSIDLIVSDGTLRATNAIVVRVWTVGSAVGELTRAVESLGWSKREVRALFGALKAAQRAVERGDFRQAVRHLQGFQAKVQRRMAPRNSAAASVLIDWAQELVLALEVASR